MAVFFPGGRGSGSILLGVDCPEQDIKRLTTSTIGDVPEWLLGPVAMFAKTGGREEYCFILCL